MSKKFIVVDHSGDGGNYTAKYTRKEHGGAKLKLRAGKEHNWSEDVMGKTLVVVEDHGNGLNVTFRFGGGETTSLNYSQAADLRHVLNILYECGGYFNETTIEEKTQ